MSLVAERTVYAYTELTGRAKDAATATLAEFATDGRWWEYTYDDCAQALRWMGFEVSANNIWSQGDGASFTGKWNANKLELVKLREERPTDMALHALALRAQTFALEYPSAEAVTTRGSSRYVHECTMVVDLYLEGGHGESASVEGSEADETMTSLVRGCARWVYRQLEQEYEYLTSEEALAELAEVNEWEFDESGQLV